MAEPPDPYNPYLPGTLDTAYDRAMTLHFRSPAVTDTYLSERGWPPTPPIRGLYPYRVRAWGAVYQYDGLRTSARSASTVNCSPSSVRLNL